MNWALSEEVQSNTVAPSVRTDINTDKPWDVPEANMAGFPLFMEDRETVEEWKQTFTLYIGEGRASVCIRACKILSSFVDCQAVHSFN